MRSFHVIDATCDVRELASGLAQEFPVRLWLVIFVWRKLFHVIARTGFLSRSKPLCGDVLCCDLLRYCGIAIYGNELSGLRSLYLVT